MARTRSSSKVSPFIQPLSLTDFDDTCLATKYKRRCFKLECKLAEICSFPEEDGVCSCSKNDGKRNKSGYYCMLDKMVKDEEIVAESSDFNLEPEVSLHEPPMSKKKSAISINPVPVRRYENPHVLKKQSFETSVNFNLESSGSTQHSTVFKRKRGRPPGRQPSYIFKNKQERLSFFKRKQQSPLQSLRQSSPHPAFVYDARRRIPYIGFKSTCAQSIITLESLPLYIMVLPNMSFLCLVCWHKGSLMKASAHYHRTEIKNQWFVVCWACENPILLTTRKELDQHHSDIHERDAQCLQRFIAGSGERIKLTSSCICITDLVIKCNVCQCWCLKNENNVYNHLFYHKHRPLMCASCNMQVMNDLSAVITSAPDCRFLFMNSETQQASSYGESHPGPSSVSEVEVLSDNAKTLKPLFVFDQEKCPTTMPVLEEKLEIDADLPPVLELMETKKKVPHVNLNKQFYKEYLFNRSYASLKLNLKRMFAHYSLNSALTFQRRLENQQVKKKILDVHNYQKTLSRKNNSGRSQ